jgi:FMN reductase
VIAFPLMLGGAWNHGLAPEVFLKPVLVELGANCPVRGLYLLDSDYETPDGLEEWVEEARRFL